jgi:hypothetical protein
MAQRQRQAHQALSIIPYFWQNALRAISGEAAVRWSRCWALLAISIQAKD